MYRFGDALRDQDASSPRDGHRVEPALVASLRKPPKLTTRAHLIERLHQASEAEHSLCCQYLYAAFSLRRTATDFPAESRGDVAELVMTATQHWAYEMYYVARQEMEHLAIATNLLTAIGERPHLSHGDFPDAKLAVLLQNPMILERCNEQALRRFQFFERPSGPGFEPPPAVETIYLDIQQLFATLPASDLFTGEGERQISSSDVELGLQMQIPVVTSRTTAGQAVDLILAQGEGLGASPLSKDTHFARFNDVLQSYLETSELGLDPYLPVVTNPVSHDGTAPIPEGATVVTNGFSAALMDFFDEGYRLMLIMLKEFFWAFRGYSGMFDAVEAVKTTAEMQANRRVAILSENAYYPFMTMFVRPVGELLARQPAFEDVRQPERAGAAFRTGGAVPIWTDMDLYVDGVGALGSRATTLAKDAPDGAARDALTYLSQNLSRMRMNILNVWHQTG